MELSIASIVNVRKKSGWEREGVKPVQGTLYFA